MVEVYGDYLPHQLFHVSPDPINPYFRATSIEQQTETTRLSTVYQWLNLICELPTLSIVYHQSTVTIGKTPKPC